MEIKDIKKIKELYNSGENLLAFFRKEKNISFNDTASIMISYDFQTGSYIKFVERNQDYIKNYTSKIAEVISSFSPESILEAGVGEATTLANIAIKLPESVHPSLYGFDLAWSRIKCGEEYCKSKNIKNITLFTGDLFNSPLLDNSIDVVYTSHSIEPNGGKEKEALEELYRITSKYLVLFEPCFELANKEAQKRMQEHGYITKLQETIKELGYKVIEFRLFDYFTNPLNPTGMTIIEKNPNAKGIKNPLACPIVKAPLIEFSGCMYCEESMVAYPILKRIKCLLPENAILATHFKDFL